MKYDKQMHKNNLQNSESEKKSLLCENEKLKNQLAEALARLDQEVEKNKYDIKSNYDDYNFYSI